MYPKKKYGVAPALSTLDTLCSAALQQPDVPADRRARVAEIQAWALTVAPDASLGSPGVETPEGAAILREVAERRAYVDEDPRARWFAWGMGGEPPKAPDFGRGQ
ncbi:MULTISPECIES: hypothetical protein [Methylobacterium]|uniref:hypothetical protein n=1 Tax=Methylobacterium TaxID=407 RepID=UPI002F2EE2D0